MSTDDSVTRRDFVVAGVLSGLGWASGPVAAVSIAPVMPSASDTKKVLTDAQTTLLMSVARTIAPHDGLSDAAYALVVQAIADSATADANTRTIVSSSVERLGKDFVSRSEAQRVQLLKAVEHSEFFRLARTQTLGILYRSPIAYAHFGYQGEAFSKGGYLQRGFNDLKWLPDVPVQDSGPDLTS